jgi:uncharacterized protein
LTHSTEDNLFIPDGYQYNVISRWSDSLLPDARAVDPRTQQPAIQNADFIGFLPLPAGSATSDPSLPVVNHAYTNPELMFADWDGKHGHVIEPALIDSVAFQSISRICHPVLV